MLYILAMFSTKRQPEAVKSVHVKTSGNKFLREAAMQTNTTLSGNGAHKLTTTNNPFVDQFKGAGTYLAKREFSVVAADQSALWGIDPLLSLKFIGYLRTIGRSVKMHGQNHGIHKGAGLKSEPIMRLIWLATHHKEVFVKNLPVFVALGSWKDIFTMLQTDLVYNGFEDRKLPWFEIFNFISAGLNSNQERSLVLKYLPQVKARSKCKTIEAQADNALAKWLCSLLISKKENDPVSYKNYRKLKASGSAHTWQQLISQQRYSEIDFNRISGKALMALTKSKTFLNKSGLRSKFSEWIGQKAVKGQSVNSTGWVHEILHGFNLPKPLEEQQVANAQFQKIIEDSGPKMVGQELIVVRDTSGSMDSPIVGAPKYTSDHLARCLGIFFAEFCTGTFANHYIEFANTARLISWMGSTPTEKYNYDVTHNKGCVGSTHFMSVITLMCQMRQNGVPEEEFPRGILLLSDMEFNRIGTGLSNYQAAMNMLRQYFSQDYVNNFRMIFWDIYNSFYGEAQIKSETFSDCPNVFYFGGFSPSVLSFLTGASDADEAFLNAMDQPLLNMLTL